MNFPSSDDLQSFETFLQLSSIRDRVVAARPELESLTSTDAVPHTLTIDLPPGPRGIHPRVVLARFRSQRDVAWLVAGPSVHQDLDSVWELQTANEVLAEAVLATYE